MLKADKILVICSQGEINLNEIAEIMGWKTGSVAVTINRLIGNGFLKKTRYGFYTLTDAGFDRVQKSLDEEQKEQGKIDIIVNRTVALFTTDSRYDIFKTFQYEKDSRRPPGYTKELRETVKKIYLESLGSLDTGHFDYDTIKGIWRSHQEPTCECGFDFESAYENHSDEIKKITSQIELVKKLNKRYLFKNLRWESFPIIERYRRNFDRPTSYTEPIIPDDWDK